MVVSEPQITQIFVMDCDGGGFEARLSGGLGPLVVWLVGHPLRSRFARSRPLVLTRRGGEQGRSCVQFFESSPRRLGVACDIWFLYFVSSVGDVASPSPIGQLDGLSARLHSVRAPR